MKQTPSSKEDSFSIEEAAELCHTSIWTIHRRIKEGEIHPYRAGGRSIRIPKTELLRFMQQNHIPVPPELEEEQTRLLIVDDDDKMVNALLRYFYQKTKFKIETASSGFRAGGLIETFRPHVVILDLMLGDVNGREVIKVLRANPHHVNVKVIAISGFVKEEEIQELLDLGFDAFFAKPFSVPDLLRNIQTLMSQEGARFL